jgi:hypothetical protein
LMAIHNQIHERQVTHLNITWIGWGIVWVFVLLILFRPRAAGRQVLAVEIVEDIRRRVESEAGASEIECISLPFIDAHALALRSSSP